MRLCFALAFLSVLSLDCFSQCNSDFNSTASSVCSGNAVNFINTSIGSSNYSWKINEVQFSNSTDASYLFSTAGSFSIELIASDGLGCFDSTFILITVNQTPTINVNVTPMAINLGDSVYVTFPTTGVIAGTTFSWSFCDAVVGASNVPFYYSWDNDGVYCVCVQIDNNNGCVDNDCENGIVVTYVDGINELSESGISVYPNPSSGNFTIDLSQINNFTVTVIIFDSSNRAIRTYENITTTQLIVDRNNLANGYYNVVIETEKSQLIVPVILD